MTTMRRVPGNGRAPFDKMLRDLKAANVRVGWFESSKYPDDKQTPVAYVAAINELGPHARPFMRTTADERDKEWAALMLQFSKRVVKGTWTVEQSLEAMGLTAAADIQKKIAEISRGGGLSLITLVARKMRLNGEKVTGSTIGQIAARIHKDESAVRAEVADIKDAPLNDTGYMRATISVSVNDKPPKTIGEA